MNQQSRVPISVTFALISVLISGCGGGDTSTATDERIPVFTSTVARADLSNVRSYAGTVEGIRQATVYARIPETVQTVFVKEGERVARGDPLVAFDESGPGSAVRQARALADDARRNAEKYQRLYEQGAISEIERDRLQTQYEVAQANYEAARDQTLVTAPISGFVADVYTRAGRQVTLGEPLALLAAVDTVRVLLDISVFESGDILRGQRVTVRSGLDTALAIQGWVDEVSTSANTESRNVSVEVLLVNPDHRLMPGQFLLADIELERHDAVRSVPREALVYRQAGMGVFVVRDSSAYYTPVSVGIESGDRVELIDGPDVGAVVVTLGQSNLQDGTRVNPTRDTRPSGAKATTP